jgi:hypothetical protein
MRNLTRGSPVHSHNTGSWEPLVRIYVNRFIVTFTVSEIWDNQKSYFNGLMGDDWEYIRLPSTNFSHIGDWGTINLTPSTTWLYNYQMWTMWFTWERQFKVSNYVHLSLIGICISLDNIYPKLQLGKNALKLVKKILKKWPITIENK